MLNIVDWTSWTIVIAESIARPMSYVVKELHYVSLTIYIYQIGDDRTRCFFLVNVRSIVLRSRL